MKNLMSNFIKGFLAVIITFAIDIMVLWWFKSIFYFLSEVKCTYGWQTILYFLTAMFFLVMAIVNLCIIGNSIKIIKPTKNEVTTDETEK